MLDWLLQAVLMLLARLQAEDHCARRSGAGRFALYTRFCALVELHYVAHWPVPRYAQTLRVQDSKLNRACNALAGKPALEIIHDRLMLEARRRLVYISASVANIAYELGYQDPAYFCRVFKRHSGMSPSAYRLALQATGTGDAPPPACGASFSATA
jgi:AraC family transcriptional activator of pobA